MSKNAKLYVSIAMLAMSVSGCASMAQKPQSATQPVAPQAQPVPMDADIQRILSAGGIDPAGPAAVALTTPDPVAVPVAPAPAQTVLPSLPPPPASSASGLEAVATPGQALQLTPDALSLPPSVAVGGGSYDYMGNFNLPASVSAGILPSPELAGSQVVEITGPNAQELPKPATRPRKPATAPVPAQRPASFAEAAPVMAPRTPTPVYLPPITNVDKPISPVKRF